MKWTPADEWRALLAAARAKALERRQTIGAGGYIAFWMLMPILELSLLAIVYAERPALLAYAVVGVAAQQFVMASIYFTGEILDRERLAGTLPALFLAPCARLTWLVGASLVGLIEASLTAGVALLFGRLALGVTLQPNWPALLLTLPLFLVAIWGLGFVYSAIGLLLKKANQFSNLIYPPIMLLGGVYYPIALLPDWLQLPARLLPYGHGLQALAAATLDGADLAQLAPSLLPLAAFALLTPLLGATAFARLERLVRHRGELDLH